MMHIPLLLNTPDPIISIIAVTRICIPLIALALGVYLLVAIPQQKALEHKVAKLKNLTVGTLVTTHSGDTGVVESFTGSTIIIHHNDGRKIEVTPQALARIHHENA